LRILTVSHFYETHGGGIERVAGQLCRELNRLGATVAWAASDSDRAQSEGVEAIPLACVNPTEKLTGLPMPIPGLRGYRALEREIRRSDAVLIHDALYATSVIAMLIAKRHRKRTILIQHIASIPFSSPALRALMKLANRLVTGPMLRSADSLVFISDTVRQELLGGLVSRPYELLFNGVDGAIFQPAQGKASVPEGVGSIEFPAQSRHVLFVGRYVEKKGLAVLRELASSRPELTFFLVGAGPIQPRDWALANVHDLGPRTAHEVADLYRWADLLLLPSVGEGFPLVVQEAMASGLPVICGKPTDRADPGASRWLHGVSIDLTDAGASARRCANAIDSIDLEPAERQAMASYAARHYDWATMARGIIDLAQGGKVATRA
jgi:glycosyltransferase involved in cell wall biosynthesis